MSGAHRNGSGGPSVPDEFHELLMGLAEVGGGQKNSEIELTTFYDHSDPHEQSLEALIPTDTSVDVTAIANLTKRADRDLLIDRLWRGEYLADIDAFRACNIDLIAFIDDAISHRHIKTDVYERNRRRLMDGILLNLIPEAASMGAPGR